ncbi:MAG: CvpA family protein [Flavobacteriales bacterium]|nr:CvpA family protein [Flavobacteriales bacterium]
MNYLDIAIAAPLLYGLVKGFSNGLIKEITGLLSLVVGIYIALNFSNLLEPHLRGVFDNYEQFKPLLAFAILFISVLLLIKLLGYLADKLTKALALGFLSRIFGGIFGMLKIALIISFLLMIESKFELIPQENKQSAQLYKPTVNLVELLNPHIEKHKGLLEDFQERTKEAKENIQEKFKKE